MASDAPSPSTKVSVFVHDSSPISREFSAAALGLVAFLTPETMAESVRRACERENVTGVLGLDGQVLSPLITLGLCRWRTDAVVVPMKWEFPMSAGLPLQADLELASYTADCSHLHLLGRVTLPNGIVPRTQAASLFGRCAVAVVRHVLNDLADVLTTDPKE